MANTPQAQSNVDSPQRVEPCVPESDAPFIKLDQFLKLAGVVSTGGQAKPLILSGQVRVNGEVETRRGRKLRFGDEVVVLGQVLQVRWNEEEG